MEIKKVNYSVRDLVEKHNYSYIGSGASKEVYLNNDTKTVIKIPKGVTIMPGHFIYKFPNNLDELDSILFYIYDTISEAYVWSIGQIIGEVCIWNILCELEKRGIKAKQYFAEIKNVYVDIDNIIFIEQEYVPRTALSKDFNILDVKLRILESFLVKNNVVFRDICGANVGRTKGGKVKVFDYGLPSDSLYSYESYDEYYDCCTDYDYNSYC